MISSAAFIVLELLGRLVLSAGSTAVGQVIDDAGEPVAAEVALRNPEDSLAMAGTADDGRFAIPRVPPGKYDLEVRASGFATARVPGVAIDAAGEVDLGTVVLARAVTLSGRVIDAEGVPITGAEIATHRGEPRFSSFEPPHGAAVTTAADGAFALPDLGADEQWVLAVTRNGYAGRMVRAVTAHGAPPLEIVLHPASRLAGRVIDDRAHPVAGAAVMLHPVRSDVVGAAAQTDVDGRFRLEQVPSGPAQVAVHADGYAPARLPALEVPEGGEVDDLEVVLRPAVVLAGKVTLPDGRPADGALVEVSSQSPEDPTAGVGVTDHDGRYRLAGLAPGLLIVTASLHGLQRSPPKAIDVEVGTYALDLELAPGFEVAGHVSDAAGLPVAGVSLTLHEGDVNTHAGGATVRSAGDGTFAFAGVTSGLYAIEAAKEGYATARTTEAVAVDGDVYGVAIEMERGATLRGRVLGLELDELAEVSLMVFSEVGGSRRARVDFEGAYELANLARGRWKLLAAAGGRRLEADVEIAPGDLEVVRDRELRGGFTLSGAVLESGPGQSPRPAGGAFVTLRVDGASAHATTDSEGRFRLAELPAGSYELRIGWGSVFHREPIELADDDEIEIVLGTAWIEGQVAAAGGPPLAGVSVGLEPVEDEGRPPFFVNLGYSPETDADGRFRVSPLLLGRWRLTFAKAGFADVEVVVDLRSGAAVEGLLVEMSAASDET